MIIRYIIILLGSILTVSAQEKIAITHGPYLCDMDTDGVTVVWTTNKPALSWVEIAPMDNDHFYAKERKKYFDTVAGRKRANQTIHRVRINGLTSATQYRYRIFSKEITEWKSSNWVIYGNTVASGVYQRQPFTFTTFSDNKATSQFIVINDIHGKAPYMKDLFKNIDFKNIDFVALNGDMSNTVENEKQIFSDYIDSCVTIFAKETPIVFNRGNHETRGVMSDKLIDYFPTRNGKFYQIFNVGKVCFLILDGGEDKPDSDIEYSGIADYDSYREEEALWLKKAVQNDIFKNASARIVLLHIPPTVGNWHGNLHLQKTLLPILNNQNINIMFSGHTHRYSFHEPDDKARFPIVVNDNKSLVVCSVDENNIKIEISGINQSDKRVLNIPVHR